MAAVAPHNWMPPGKQPWYFVAITLKTTNNSVIITPDHPLILDNTPLSMLFIKLWHQCAEDSHERLFSGPFLSLVAQHIFRGSTSKDRQYLAHNYKTWTHFLTSACTRSMLGCRLLALANKETGVTHWVDANSSRDEVDVDQIGVCIVGVRTTNVVKWNPLGFLVFCFLCWVDFFYVEPREWPLGKGLCKEAIWMLSKWVRSYFLIFWVIFYFPSREHARHEVEDEKHDNC